MGRAYLLIYTDVDSAVLLVSHFSIPRPAVTFKQLLNCVFLFTIYVPQSPPPLPEWLDASEHARIFTARWYTFGNRCFKDPQLSSFSLSDWGRSEHTLASFAYCQEFHFRGSAFLSSFNFIFTQFPTNILKFSVSLAVK